MTEHSWQQVGQTLNYNTTEVLVKNPYCKTVAIPNAQQHITEEYFVKMMMPQIQKIAKPFEDEEGETLANVIKTIESTTYNLVVVGAGTLFYVEHALEHGMQYIAIEPLIDIFLQKQIKFIVQKHSDIKYIGSEFGIFDTKELGQKKSLFAFIFNILGYIQQPLTHINKYLKAGDILFIASWNSESMPSVKVRDDYFSALNEASDRFDNIMYNKETTGLCRLDHFPFHALKYYQHHKRIKNTITDILIIYC